MAINGNESLRTTISEGDPPEASARAHSKEASPRSTNMEKNRLRAKELSAAKTYLENTKMVIIGDPFTIPALVTSLLHISQSTGTKSALIEGIKAVAALIKDAYRREEEEEIANHLDQQLSFSKQQLTVTLDEVQNIATEIQLMSQEIRKERSKTLMGVATALNALDKTTTYAAVASTKSQTKDLPTRQDTAEAAILAKRSIKARQILIDDTDGENSSTRLGNLTSEELIQKANIALEAITGPTGKAVKAVTANKLQNGGIVYELDNIETARLIREDKGTRKHFIENFSSHAEVKPRTFPIIVERVPIKFNPEDESHLRNLEDANNIADYEIVKARWIKPPARRSTTQRAGHLILLLSNQQAANNLIRDGTRIAQTVLWTRKLLKEPSRCLKCHQIGTGHLANTCPEEEKCGTCGRSHSTRTCTVLEKEDQYCINCRTNGHASWDRSCPTFIERNERMAKQVPDNQFRYFPINGETDSWERLDGSFPQNQREPPNSTQTPSLGEVGRQIAELLTTPPRERGTPTDQNQLDKEQRQQSQLFFPDSSPPAPSPSPAPARKRPRSQSSPPPCNMNTRNPTLLLTQPPNQATLTSLETWITVKKKNKKGNTNPPHSQND